MDALSILVHATIWLVWLTALYMILTPLSDPPSPLLDLPPERLQFLKDELSSSDSRCARILKQQIEEIKENIEIQRKLDQNIADESQKIKTAVQRLVTAMLKSRPSGVGPVQSRKTTLQLRVFPEEIPSDVAFG
ncbi:unnamed protein product [Clonostachys byssicola]|uniref:Uncharacterized protein n=1 Tax=Clonostachys byssicola TaxID=160290 RepID=A0A9N9U2Z2_9HYPO|nr:unnamed protein product [Clonostachys byssicola]